MLKLRKILLSNYLYLIVLIVVLLISLYRLNIKKTSIYNESITNIIGTISAYHIDGNKLSLTITSKESIIASFYFKTSKEKNYYSKLNLLGMKVKVTGEVKSISCPTTKNIYNYKNAMSHKNIHYSMTISKINLLSKNKNIYYTLKSLVTKRLNNNPYLYTFILGDKSYLKKEVITSYQNNGISHLFAISGMHISLLSGLILKLLKKLKLKEEKRYFLTSILLISYLFLTGLSISILRGVLFFLLFSINKIYYLYIKSINIFILTLAISLLINPFYLFEVAFYYSFLISLSLISLSSFINKYSSYLKKLLLVSLISFLISIPISLYTFYQINPLSIIYNLFYVPFISIIVFPLALLTFLFPIISPLFNLTIFILEKTSLFFNEITIFILIFKKGPLIIYLLYLIFIILIFIFFTRKKYYLFIPFLLLISIHYFYPYFIKSTYLKMIDVGQGDSILLVSNGKSILIDTGGIMSYENKPWQQKNNKYSHTKSITIPLLKSLGLKKLNYLILTHGDYDHMGESLDLLTNFKVDNIVINDGFINYLERNITSKYSNIIIGREGLTLECGALKLVELNKKFTDENDSSQVYLAVYKDIKMLFMGDASLKSESYILDKYRLPKVNILKVGHHGSRTSSSKKFLQTVKPNISLISVGLDNKFSHPHQEVIVRLEEINSNILMTSNSGTITIDLDNYQVLEDAKKTM